MTIKTKSPKWKTTSIPLLVVLFGLLGLGGVSLWGNFDFVSSAGRIPADVDKISQTGRTPGTDQISDDDIVSVEGVSNKTQYLTALVLHSPRTRDVIQLFYDESGVLRIGGNVNADALVVKGEGRTSATATNANLGGTSNNLTKSVNSAIIGGESNTVNESYSSIILGGKGNRVLKGNNTIFAMTDSTTIPASQAPKKNIFVWGGVRNVVDGSRIAIFSHGGASQVASDALLMGANINANGLNNLFVWSDSASFAPKKSNGLYINTEKGLGLNTTKPVVQLDAGNAGGLKVKKANKLNFSGSSGNKGLIVALENANGKKGYCGFDGRRWVALDSNPETQKLCANIGSGRCKGNPTYTIKGNSGPTDYLWNPQGNGGNGSWDTQPWIYHEKKKEELGTCEYVCQVGYHPAVNNPTGWFTESCQKCTDFPNRWTLGASGLGTINQGANNGWKTAGTGDDNCDFWCKASFKYENLGKKKQSCKSCEIGTYTKDKNQDKTCKNCSNKHDKLVYKVFERGLDGGILPSSLGGELTGDRLSSYTTNGTGEKTCKWTCQSGLISVETQLGSLGSAGVGGSVGVGGGFGSMAPSQIVNGYCKCKDGTHLEKGVCVANTQNLQCGGSKPSDNGNILFGPSSYVRTGTGYSNKTESQWIWDAKKQWRRISNHSVGLGTPGGSSGFGAALGPCQFKCKDGSSWNASTNSCEKTVINQCQGAIPEHAYPASNNEETGLPNNTTSWHYVANNTTAKCEYLCEKGYSYQNGACNPINYRCTGTIPANADLIPGDDQGLLMNTPRTLVEFNSDAKCEYLCTKGYVYQNGACVEPTPTTRWFDCGDLYNGQKWNTVSGYFQTWDGNSWIPEDSLLFYNETPSTTSCRYICAEGYERLIVEGDDGNVIGDFCVLPKQCVPNFGLFGDPGSLEYYQAGCSWWHNPQDCERIPGAWGGNNSHACIEWNGNGLCTGYHCNNEGAHGGGYNPLLGCAPTGALNVSCGGGSCFYDLPTICRWARPFGSLDFENSMITPPSP